MNRLGLTRTQLRAYHRALVSTHERRIIVQVLDLDGRVLRSLTPAMLDGEVTFEVTRVPTRILDLRFLDPSRSLGFEPDSPGDAPLHRSRMIRIYDSRRVTELDMWVDCPVFTGPIHDFERHGAEVAIVAHGKEEQAMGQKWKTRTFAKKSKKTLMIRTVMADTGETRMSIPDLRATLPKRVVVHRLDQPWMKVRSVASSMNRQLFYDGAGRLRLRQYPSRPVYTFHSALLSEPQVRRDIEGLKNIVEFVGGKPKGQKTRVRAVASLPARHPLSPQSLGRNGKSLYLAERRVNPHVKTNAEARARALKIRDDRARVTTEYAFDAMPIPHLDEHDLVAVVGEDGTFLVRMRTWTLPLGTDANPMPVGSSRRTIRARSRR